MRGFSSLQGVTVEVEADPPANIEKAPWVGIFLNSWESSSRQVIAAGTAKRILVEFELVCVGADMEEFRTAAKRRDDLMGNVQLALLSDVTFGGTVELREMTGGEFDNANAEGGGILASGTIRVQIEQQART